MKKFYALALSASLALAAVAAPQAQFSRDLTSAQLQIAALQRPVNISTADSQFNSANFAAQRIRKVAMPYQTELATKAAPTTRDEVCGQYTWEFYDLFENAQYYSNITISADPAVENGVVLDLLGVPVKATVDMTIKNVEGVGEVAGVMTIPNQYAFTDNQGNEAWFVYEKWADSSYSDIVTPDTDLTCFIGDGYIDFYLLDIITFKAADGSGYYFASDENAMMLGWTEYEEETWTAIGYTDFHDCWIMPSFEINPNDYVYEVAIERSDLSSTRYRLVDPYNNELFAEVNSGDGHGYIVFDVADPGCVVLDTQTYCGLSLEDMGRFFCLNYAGYLVGYGYDTATIKAQFESLGDEAPCVLSTYEDGVATISDGVIYFDTAEGPYMANVYNSTIAIPGEGGINDISVDTDTDCPVQYFNLQGIPVAEPQPGTVYIRQQGRTAVKVIR